MDSFDINEYHWIEKFLSREGYIQTADHDYGGIRRLSTGIWFVLIYSNSHTEHKIDETLIPTVSIERKQK